MNGCTVAVHHDAQRERNSDHNIKIGQFDLISFYALMLVSHLEVYSMY